MTMGINPPTPEALRRFARYWDAMSAAIAEAKKSDEWPLDKCLCQQCVARRHLAIQKRLPKELA